MFVKIVRDLADFSGKSPTEVSCTSGQCALVVLLFGSLLYGLCMGLCDQVSPEVKLFSWVVWGSSENGWVHTSQCGFVLCGGLDVFCGVCVCVCECVCGHELPTHTSTPCYPVPLWQEKTCFPAGVQVAWLCCFTTHSYIVELDKRDHAFQQQVFAFVYFPGSFL